jgi:hypothetical protein
MLFMLRHANKFPFRWAGSNVIQFLPLSLERNKYPPDGTYWLLFMDDLPKKVTPAS